MNQRISESANQPEHALRNTHYALIIALLLLAFALRVFSLSSQSVWWDEAFTWQTTSHGWDNLWHMLQTGDRNPPLYFVLTTVWGGLAGWSEFSLRFVPLICGVIGVALLFALARRLFGLHAGVWTLGIAAVAPALVMYSQEARMYALFFALTAAMLYWAVRSAERGFADRRIRIALLASEAALLLTHYFAVPLIAALNLLVVGYLFRKRVRLSDYARWLIGQLAAATPLIVWTLWIFSAPAGLIQAAEQPPGAFVFARQVVTLWFTGVRDLGGALGPLAVIGLLAIGAAAIGARRIDRARTGCLIVFGASALLIGFALTQVLTSFHPRYLLAFSVPVWVLIGVALAKVVAIGGRRGTKNSDQVLRLAGSGGALLLSIGLIGVSWSIALNPIYAKDDVRGVAAYLKANAGGDDVVLVEANDYTLNYYDHGLAQTKMITATTEPDALKQLTAATGDAQRVWLVHWNTSTQDPRGYWPFLLEQSGTMKDRTSYRGYEVYRYDLQAALRQPAVESLSLRVTDSLLRRWSGVEGQGADGVLALAAEWQPPVKLYDAASVSIRLLGAQGETISSVDRPLLDDQGRTTDRWGANQVVVNYYVLPIPPGTPPLSYTLTVQLYTARDVLTSQILAVFQLPRRLNTADPYRTLGGYHWNLLANPQVLSGLALEACAISPQTPWGPMPIDVTLRWRKTGDAEGVEPKLRLVQSDRIWAEAGSTLFEREYPIAQWVIGETVIDRLRIEYPPVRGPIELQIGQGEQWTTLTTLQLDESQMMFAPPAMQHTQSAQFGDFAGLLGYDLKSNGIAPDQPLPLIVFWRATKADPITTAYTVFTQLIAPDGHLVAQDDAPPNPPTVAWVPGQIVADTHALKLVDTTYRGPVTLIVGWYNSASVVRVPASTGGDFVRLDTPIAVEDR